MQTQSSRIVHTLKEIEGNIGRERFFESRHPDATAFALTDRFAFLVATCLDRGAPSAVIWTIPWDLFKQLGHLDPRRLASMDLGELDRVIRALPHRPRYVNDAARTVHDLSNLITRRFGGDPEALWRGRHPTDVQGDLQGLRGVGPGIASMAITCLLRAFGPVFQETTLRDVDIKPDVHTRRVLQRLGLSQGDSDSEAISAARRLQPEAPCLLDAPLWWTGRNWCHASAPDCGNCALDEYCPKLNVPGTNQSTV